MARCIARVHLPHFFDNIPSAPVNIPSTTPTAPLRNAVRGVALFEAAKGLLALLAMLGLLSLLHHDLHHLALEVMDHMGLSPHQPFATVVLRAVDGINATPESTLVLIGSLYITARWLEAWGLWHDKVWGEWLGVISCGLYVPLEVMHLWHNPRWQGAAVLIANLAIIEVLAVRLRQRKTAPHKAPLP